MKFFDLVLLAASLLGVSAQQQPLFPYVFVVNGPPFNDYSIHATGNRFWVGRPTTAIKDQNRGFQTEGVRTIFNQPSARTKELRLSSYQPHSGDLTRSQRCYIAPNGAMSFLSPGEPLPSGSIAKKFEVTGFGTLQAINPKNSSLYLFPYICPGANKKEGEIYFLDPQKETKCKSIALVHKYAYGAYEYV